MFGTQYDYKVVNGQQLPWTMEPYNRSLVSPAVRQANCVIDLEDGELGLQAIAKGEDPKPPKRQPCPAASQNK